MSERREVYYSGRVQGVGFRYTARHIAARHLAEGQAVTGFVQNLPDGRVLLVAEGEPADIDAFLDSVARELGRHIRSVEQTRQPATGEFADFGVRY